MLRPNQALEQAVYLLSRPMRKLQVDYPQIDEARYEGRYQLDHSAVCVGIEDRIGRNECEVLHLASESRDCGDELITEGTVYPDVLRSEIQTDVHDSTGQLPPGRTAHLHLEEVLAMVVKRIDDHRLKLGGKAVKTPEEVVC
jgi:hypothetical protein